MTNLSQILGALEELQASKLKPFLLKSRNYLSNLRQTQLKQESFIMNIKQFSAIITEEIVDTFISISVFSSLVWHYLTQLNSHSRIETSTGAEQQPETKREKTQKIRAKLSGSKGKTHKATLNTVRFHHNVSLVDSLLHLKRKNRLISKQVN